MEYKKISADTKSFLLWATAIFNNHYNNIFWRLYFQCARFYVLSFLIQLDFNFFSYDVYYKHPTAYYLRLKKMLFSPCVLKLDIFVNNEDCSEYSKTYEKVEKFQGIDDVLFFFKSYFFHEISFMKQKKGPRFSLKKWKNISDYEKQRTHIYQKQETHIHIHIYKHTHQTHM